MSSHPCRRAYAALALLLLSAGLSGCLIYDEPGPTEVTGEVDGYVPTQSFLKLDVLTEDGRRVSLEFDRRDWHVRELADRVDHRQLRELAVAGHERNIPGSVLALTFVDPEDLNALRYEAMGASAEERERMDAEYEAWLRERAADGVPEGKRVDVPALAELPPVQPM